MWILGESFWSCKNKQSALRITTARKSFIHLEEEIFPMFCNELQLTKNVLQAFKKKTHGDFLIYEEVEFHLLQICKRHFVKHWQMKETIAEFCDFTLIEWWNLWFFPTIDWCFSQYFRFSLLSIDKFNVFLATNHQISQFFSHSWLKNFEIFSAIHWWFLRFLTSIDSQILRYFLWPIDKILFFNVTDVFFFH